MANAVGLESLAGRALLSVVAVELTPKPTSNDIPQVG
jgi:hypothetical protein